VYDTELPTLEERIYANLWDDCQRALYLVACKYVDNAAAERMSELETETYVERILRELHCPNGGYYQAG
jgi:hypothetical protein